MLSRLSNINLRLFFTVLLSIALSACFVSTTDGPSLSVSTATVSPTSTQSPASIDYRAAQKQELLSEASRAIAEYNELVEQEKLLGNINILHNSDTGLDAFVFTGESDKKVRKAHENLFDRINALYDEYLTLYKQDYNPTPFPSLATKNQKLGLYYQLLQEDQIWVETQLKSETALKTYEPDLGTYESLLDFEQTAWLELRGQALNNLRTEAELTPEILALHKNLVEKLDGAPVEASEITSLPFYRSDLTLFQYQTKNNYYVLNAEGMIIQIIPIQMPLSNTLTPNAPLSTARLEEKALSLINLFAPGTDLQILTPAGGSKIGSFFFRWEDRTKPLLDDGRSYPFIQVALNSDGELLNYYNTLPLSR